MEENLNQEQRENLNNQKVQDKINSDKTKKIVKKVIIYGIIILVVAAIIYFPITNAKKPGQYDDFAKCLTEKNANFFGSFQCPHCADQKKLFGKSIKYVNYIECGPLSGPENQVCIDAGVKVYPTWIFNKNDTREGVLSLNELSEATGCVLTKA